jgi:hypothetical protein
VSEFLLIIFEKNTLMKIKFQIAIYFVFLFSYTQAQVATKLDVHLFQKLQSEKYAKSNLLMPLLVKGNVAVIEKQALKVGGKYRLIIGDICSVEIPYNHLMSFSRLPAIERIENTFAKGMSFADTARIRNNVNEVHNGNAPLTKPYTGKNTVVGIIDGSMFFQHKDFAYADGRTRIRFMWDQVSGQFWDSTDINTGNCNYIPPAGDQGHGTTVAGIAVGNGLSWISDTILKKRYTGVAPDANIIIVNVNYSAPNFLQSVADAISYIFIKADELGLPCVVNTSLGTYYGSHDGLDLNAQAIGNLVTSKKGRAVVAAGGNAGNVKFHVSYNLSNTDSLFTWFRYNATSQDIYFDFWADTAQFKLANFAIGCDDNTPAFLGRSKYYNVPSDFNPPQGSGIMITDSIFQGPAKLGTYSIYTELYGGAYHVEFLIKPSNTAHLWRLQTKGTGKFDLWANKALMGTADIVTTLPGSFTSPNYRFPDSLKTIVSSWQCSDEVITVANYYNQAAYLDMDSIYQPGVPTGDIPGAIAFTSSIGPTRDGRVKPEIAATGTTILASGDSFHINSLSMSPANREKVAYGAKHNRNGGTSMASPVVAGAVAMYLEKRPMAGYNEIKQAIRLAAKTDAFTGSVPNDIWGYGKLNAFNSLVLPVYGCMDPLSLNYIPSANVDTGGCAYSHTWAGTISDDWNNPLNWVPDTGCCGPNSCSINVVIPAGTPFAPRITLPLVRSGSVRINQAAQVTLAANSSWNICKNLTGGNSSNASIKGGKVILDGTTNQTISGNLHVDTLQLYNNFNATLTGNLEINNKLVLRQGLLSTNFGSLKFLSTSDTHCATIDFSTGNSGSIVGNITAQRFVPVSGSSIHLISSPIDQPAVSQLNDSGSGTNVPVSTNCDETQSSLALPNGNLFNFNESQATGCYFGGWKSLINGNFQNGRGYAALLSGNQTFELSGFANQAFTTSFSGASNSSWSTHNTAQGRPFSSGWNLVGNPYLSHINLQSKSGFDDQVQVWHTTGTYAGTYQPYMMSTNAVVAPFQAFWVKKSSSGSGTFAVSKAECINDASATAPFYKVANDYEMDITVTGNNFADKTKVGFNQDATDGFDAQYDANKFHSKLGQPTLYTLVGTQHMGINTRLTQTLNDSIPLSFEPGVNGSYTLTFDQLNTFPILTRVLLEDRKTAAAWQNLKQNNAYTFTASTTDDWDRFLIHFSTLVSVDDIEEASVDFQVYPNPFKDFTTLVFRGLNRSSYSVKITDNLGRILDQFDIDGNKQEYTYPNHKLASGVYMFSLEQGDEKLALKKIMVQ